MKAEKMYPDFNYRPTFFLCVLFTLYGGPCPPLNDKAHTYIFTVYALKVDHLPIDQNSTAPNTGYFINQNLLAKASIIVYSNR